MQPGLFLINGLGSAALAFPTFPTFPTFQLFPPKNDATSLIGSFGKQLVFGAEHKLSSQWRRQMGEHLQKREFS